jgi:ubiquinone biosynthesis protein
LGKFLELILYPIGIIKKPAEDLGKRLTSCFEKCGPIYIKFGQALSTRPDLISIEVAEHLKNLQDKLTPFSSQVAKEIIYESFGQNVHELFAEFDDLPIAAASIAQVHKARLKSGEYVAIKILRPGIHARYNNDIMLLYFMARLASNILPKLKRLKLLEVVDVFKETMKYELNLLLEAAAASELSDNFCNDDSVYIPKIYWSLSSEYVMTSEWIDGTSVYDIDSLITQGLNLEQIATKIAVMFFNQAYRNGFFHADLHPGNILVKSNGAIALLDFGIMGRLPERDRLTVAESLLGFLRRDYKLVASVHLKGGYIPANTNLDLFAQRCRAICEPIIGIPAKGISVGKLLAQLFKITEDFGMETQPQLLLLQKTMVMVEGIGQSLNPNINMWQLAEPWIKKWAAKNLSPEAQCLRLVKKIVSELFKENK